MVAQPLQSDTEVLGYRLVDRIGSGGFGEVWSAVAPGGIMKALKIVYGFHDEKRAQAELKALDRVKSLRHPFLLNLERIEIYEGQLVVVTELADKSMADLFNESILAGETGIARESILQYVRDAGDALDYMSREQNLQHLDVKPENLLMVSGHVKVADFGLIKDLHNASQSLMQGMTPAYAAPELFDGRPGSRSDQYSLAIVYQEMLTGVRPFPGSTPAQLAAQHMHGKPNLRSLPKGDQAIVAKALAKDPTHRFNTCREMADELLSRRRIKKKVVTRLQSQRSDSDTESKTAVFDSANDFTAILSSSGVPYKAAAINPIDPPVCDETASVFRPTIVIGVGATANHIVREIKQQLATRFGSMDNLPAYRFACIDSDRNGLMGLASKSESVALNLDETIPIPLRKPEAYRDHASKLKWLSRRWIYNVPRSLQTEGLRPLGRLAFADHFETLWSSLSSQLDELMLEENLAQTCETLKMNPGKLDQPRVIVVSTISGGLGSGMTLDLAYTLRLLMAEKAMKADSLMAILLHAAYRRHRDPGLAAANAFAFMTELRHFNDSGYDGDVSLGIPEFEDQSPFEFTYYKDLGRDLKQSDFEAKLSGVAEYVALSTVSKCGVFLDACRAQDKELEHFSLRSFGLSVSGPGIHGLGEMAVNRLSRGLLSRWIFGGKTAEDDALKFVDRTFSKFNLSQEAIFEGVQRESKKNVDNDRINQAMEQMVKLISAKGSALDLHIRNQMDEVYGPASENQNNENDVPRVCLEMENFIGQEAISGGDELALEFMELLNQDKLDLSLIDKCVSISQERLGEWSLALGHSLGEEAQALSLILNAIVQKSKKGALRDCGALLEEYVRRREHTFLLKYTKEFTRVLNRSLNSAAAVTCKFKSHLQLIAGEFPKDSDLSAFDNADGFNMDCLMNESIHSDLENQIARTEIQVYGSLIKDRGGYAESLNQSAVWQHRMPTEIRSAAQRVLADAYQKLCLDEIIAKSSVAPEQLVAWLNQKIAAARPEVDDCGGSMRMMLGLPTFSKSEAVVNMIENHFQLKQKTINGTYGNFAICFECEDVSLASVAFRLLEDRPDAVELVKRLHTRSDIQWSSLSDLL